MTGMEPIAHIHTDLPQKFGIPRNSFLAPHLQGRIVFEPEFASNAAVEGGLLLSPMAAVALRKRNARRHG